ncbi:hypothetical protein [Mycobacterium sp. IEC1808]|uniref:hypothetical protein n=1 Tax=Mycobacterium sp. IEC1808 TaxID=1743230 RepID=UPI00114E281B|nr:hypothetical protein [Mycobacterium sp. IEC1808]
MAWENNRGRSGGYVSPKVKETVRKRDKRCVLAYPGCAGAIEEFHHPTGLAESGRRGSVLDGKQVVGV